MDEHNSHAVIHDVRPILIQPRTDSDLDCKKAVSCDSKEVLAGNLNHAGNYKVISFSLHVKSCIATITVVFWQQLKPYIVLNIHCFNTSWSDDKF